MSAKETIKRIVDSFNNKPLLRDKTREMGEGLMLGASLADDANELSKDVQAQVDQLVVEGDSSVEAAQARVDASGKSYTTLKKRLDEKEQETTAQFQQNEKYTIFPRFFGVIPDGRDCSENFENMLKNISEKRVTIITLEKGTYFFSKTIRIPSNIKLQGNNTIFEPHEESDFRQFEPLIMISESQNINISDITFDMKGDLFEKTPYNVIMMLSAKKCLVERCKFINIGSKEIINSKTCITIISKDVPTDFAEVPNNHIDVIGSSSGNIIKDCTFENPIYKTGFAIRLISTWETIRSVSDFKYHTKQNKIQNCSFDGNYLWNPVELAGGGTVHNVVEDCIANLFARNVFDLDKGASYNIFRGLTVTNTGKPTEYKNDDLAWTHAFADHGVADYYNIGNIIEDCVVLKMSNPETDAENPYSGGLLLQNVKNTVVKNCIFKRILTQNGSGIHLRNVKNVTIDGNNIDDTKSGITSNANDELGISNVTIKNNTITNVKDVGIHLTCLAGAPSKNIYLIENDISKTFTNNNTPQCIYLQNLTNVIVSKNIVKKSSKLGNGIEISKCDKTTVDTNIAEGVNTAFRINGDSNSLAIVNGNMVSDVFANLTNSGTGLVRENGNSWDTTPTLP